MKRLFLVPHVFALIWLAGLFVSVEAQSSPSPKKGSITEKLLKESGVDFDVFQGEDSFIIIYEGKTNKEISVILIEADEAVANLSDVSSGKDVDLTPAAMKSLLEYNMKVDHIKVGISDIKSIRVQTEQLLKGLSASTLKLMIDQVAAGNDEVAKIIQPVRKKAATNK